MRRSTRPEPPREAPLIDAARKRIRLTVREVARQARISEAHWRQIISGYESLGHGEFREVHAKPETLARIALVLDLTPDQLRRVGREDAAVALEEITPDPVEEEPASYAPPADAVYAIMAALPLEVQQEVIRRLSRENPAAVQPSEGHERHAG
ncbi:helix-turn-helix transcriptional regulator [Streptomyces sp. NPDC006355]|uniref:helix-turn-helix domain-containing protein n=1 Tax=Streptomyces sp. NPDC006355 TaxID=3156758 RepID=UPI0033AC91EA